MTRFETSRSELMPDTSGIQDAATKRAIDDIINSLSKNYKNTEKDLKRVSSDIINDAKKSSVRNTVTSGPAAGLLSTASGLVATLGYPYTISYAEGYDLNGNQIDSVESIVAAETITLDNHATNFIYREKGVGIAKCNYPYAVDTEANYMGYQIGAVCATFQGANDATAYTDLHGNVFTFSAANCTISTTTPPYGTSWLKLNGTNGYCSFRQPQITSKWTIDLHFQLNATAASQSIISGTADFCFGLLFNGTSKKVCLYLSSNGSSWDIANGTAGATTILANTLYHVSLEWDGHAYRVYINGAIDATVLSTTRITYREYARVGLWGDGNNPMAGYITNLRWTAHRARWLGAAYTPPAALITPDSVFRLDPYNTWKMYYGYPGSWTAKSVVFLGEARAGHPATDGILSTPNVRIGGTATQVQFDAFSFWIAGVEYSKAAVTGQALTATTVPSNKFALFGWEIGTDGTIHSKDAAGNATGYADAAAALAAKPAPSASHVLFAWIIVTRSGASFVGATTALNQGAPNAVTTTYTNADILTDSIITAITYRYNGFYDSGWYAVVNNTNYAKSHNIGATLRCFMVAVFYSLHAQDSGAITADYFYYDSAAAYNGQHSYFATIPLADSRKVYYIQTGNNNVQWYSGAGRATGYHRLIIRRAF